jgi:hypothetical protein
MSDKLFKGLLTSSDGWFRMDDVQRASYGIFPNHMFSHYGKQILAIVVKRSSNGDFALSMEAILYAESEEIKGSIIDSYVVFTDQGMTEILCYEIVRALVPRLPAPRQGVYGPHWWLEKDFTPVLSKVLYKPNY